MPELNVVDIAGKKAASVELPKEQFGVHVHDAVIHQALVMYNANQRQGNASTKTRSEVSEAVRNRGPKRVPAVPVRDRPVLRYGKKAVSALVPSRVISDIAFPKKHV